LALPAAHAAVRRAIEDDADPRESLRVNAPGATCSIMSAMSADRVKRRRDKMRAAGLRPVQIWVPDTRAAGFAAECRRQCALVARVEATGAARAETEFWERASADAWDDLG
jgi:hypothetical protein